MNDIKPFQLNGCNIINDHDSLLTPEQICALIKKIFKSSNVVIDRKQFIINKKTALLAKNISYLGYDKKNDDLRLEKKRIQLPSYFVDYVNENSTKGITTYYMGIYSYEKEKDFLFAIFDTSSYIGKKSNNSSAHLSIYDLLSARNRGYFFKTDKFENKIYLLNTENLYDFIMNDNSVVKEYSEKEYELLMYIKKFWQNIPLELKGDECYKEMYNEGFSKTFESEWVGFYQEFLFEKFLKNNYTDLIDLHGDKKKYGIDLDLKILFAEDFYADLKADNENFDIQGNKQKTIDDILSKNGHIWYIVAAFNCVVMDKTVNFVVMETYNSLKEKFNSSVISKSKKKDINMRYSEKMKYSVKMSSFYVLDINNANQQFLLEYAQGKNSNGQERTSKYKITKKKLDEFKIFEFIK